MASVLELRELAEGQDRPDRDARQLLLERVQQIRADGPKLVYCPPAIEKRMQEASPPGSASITSHVLEFETSLQSDCEPVGVTTAQRLASEVSFC